MLTSVYIASPDAERIERVLAYDDRFMVVGSGDGEKAWREIQTLCPEVALVDQALTGMDGATLLQKMAAHMPSPPRVVLLRRMPLAPETDAVCDDPCDSGLLLAAVWEASQRPKPVLCERWESARMEIAGALLKRLGVPEGLKGARYLRAAAADCACAPGLLQGKRLYPLLAEAYHTSPAAVEKAIRTAIERTWLSGSLPEIQGLFGLSVDAEKGKPTNRECIAMLAEHTRRMLGRMMENV